ncbi:hypothetical protein HK104_002905 [Borealophlyctis nickersoniae]|nr:hypothetical protein HK104_002905 [Borealophlyctis nickersoniae]
MSAPPRNVLIGIETITKSGIQNSPVLRWALRNFVQRGDHVVIVHASKLLEGDGKAAGYTNVANPETLKDMEHTVETLVRDMAINSFNCQDIVVKASIIKADPRETIAKLAEQLQAVAVIVGRRSIGAMKRALMGSVSDFLARECNSTVIIVKAE